MVDYPTYRALLADRQWSTIFSGVDAIRDYELGLSALLRILKFAEHHATNTTKREFRDDMTAICSMFLHLLDNQ